MAITSDDIKLMQPERLTDDEDGGGQMTGLEVIDGDINNLFEDISRVNRTYGNVSLRKAFLKVDTASADLYLDAHSILSAQPMDPNVTGLLFTTDNFYDERDSARQRIESFVIQGPVTNIFLRGTQLEGQKTIICYAPTVNNVAAPEVGQTFMLQTGDDLSSQQFIKVVNVTRSSERFTYLVSGSTISTFDAQQYILELSSELKQDYPASDPSPRPTNASKLYSTQPATSAKYYGTTTLAASSVAGATSVQVAETFAPIIPTASSETPVIDQRPGGFLSQVVPASPSTIAITVAIANNAASILPTAVVPGSVSFSAGGNTYTDRGGIFVNSSGSAGALEGAAINYSTGAIAWAGSLNASNVTLNYKPGALRQQLPNTGKIEIDDTNRNFNYVLSLDPPPAPTSFNASYQYLGKWYELQDNGSGTLAGDGSGQINYDTGSIVLTLQAQPDASSVIFYRWTEPSLYSQETDEAYSSTTPVNLQLGHGKVVKSSVTISWTASTGAKTATDALGDGVISGDATGTIDYSTGLIGITSAPAPTTGGWSAQYTHKDEASLQAITTVPDNNTRADIVLATAANIEPGTVRFNLTKSIRRVVTDEDGVELSEAWWTEVHALSDNCNGNVINRRDSTNVGTVNYTTGEVIVSGTDFLKIRNAS